MWEKDLQALARRKATHRKKLDRKRRQKAYSNNRKARR